MKKISSPLCEYGLNESNTDDELFNSWKNQIIKSGNLICDHNFSFLGIENKFFGKKINWNQDIRTGHEWANKYYASFTLKELMPGDGVDIKIPWELNRFHHLVSLAQAWNLSKNKKYSDEIFSQINSWIELNPYCHGINWVNTMEVAIRAINIIVTAGLIIDAPDYEKYHNKIINLILEHGYFIEKNLEIGVLNGKIVAANHFLANISGLAIIGMSISGLAESKRWMKTGIKALEKEINTMVLDDGFFFESSTSYHRLAIELFFYPMIHASKIAHHFSDNYLNKLEKMLEVIMYINNPGNLIPQIGDNDDGRLIILSGYPKWIRNDFRYLLGLGAIIFNRGDFKSLCGPCPEEVIWLYGQKGINKYENIITNNSPIKSMAFKDSGLYVIRNDKKSDYALIKATSNHQKILTAHAHDDTLSFELWIDGEPIFVDPGTFCYTSDIKKRNYFRSKSMHNTVCVNEEGSNQLLEIEPFKALTTPKVEILNWDKNSKNIHFIAEYYGPERSFPKWKHRREIIYNTERCDWKITDKVSSGKNISISFAVRLNSYKKISFDSKSNNLQKVHIGNVVLTNLSNFDISIDKKDAYFSPSYGKNLPSTNLIIKPIYEDTLSYHITRT